MKRWYCQSDGGQWNVPVYVIAEMNFQGQSVSVVTGEKLMSMVEYNHQSALLVWSYELYDTPQDGNVVQLR